MVIQRDLKIWGNGHRREKHFTDLSSITCDALKHLAMLELAGAKPDSLCHLEVDLLYWGVQD